MIDCYTAEASRAIDKAVLADLKLPEQALMEKAGQALWTTLKKQWPEAQSIGVLAGAGNNGGDGYVLARLALEAGWPVNVFALAPSKGQADKACQTFVKAGGQMASLAEVLAADVIVDALLGTGLNAPVEGELAELIQQVNLLQKPVLAVDIPSGLCANTGARLGHAINAQLTVTFIVHKPGLYTAYGPDHTGQVVFSDLEVSRQACAIVEPCAQAVRFSDTKQWCHPRKPSTHKGACGHVVIIGGSPGMSGAALLSAIAALRVGAGKVTIATHPEHASFINLSHPEVMVAALHSTQVLDEICDQADVMVLGPGLGQTAWGEQLYAASIEKSVPKVIDADALNWMAKLGICQNEMHILTPHPAEAARLLHQQTSQIQQDRFAALDALITKSNSTVVLKGVGSLVSSPNLACYICTQGNPGMATAGMGDVLSGVIAGLWGQGLPPERAALLGTCLHAKAGDMAALNGQRGLIASDLFPFMRALLG